MATGPHYELRTYSTTGTLNKHGRAVKFGPLGVALRLNAPGMLTMTLDELNPISAELVDRSFVEVWRTDADHGIEPHMLFGGLYLKKQWEKIETSTLRLECPGYLSMLDWHIIAWETDLANRTKFTSAKGETVLKSLVTYNSTSSATTAAGRKLNGTLWPSTVITVEADGAGGNTMSFLCAPQSENDTLLTELQKAQALSGGDFSLVKTGANAFQFRWGHYNMVGATPTAATDRSATLAFSIGHGNMATPIYTRDRIKERTVALVGGKGVGAARTFVTRTGTDYASTNHREVFVPLTNSDVTAELNTAGDKVLDKDEAKETFAFKVQKTESCVFERDWNLGDTVSAVNWISGATSTLKIIGVTISYESGGEETISAEMETA